MKRKTLFIISLFLGTILGNSVYSQGKKYDIKSCIITFDEISKMGDFETKSKVMIWFDDYGMKERKETYTDGKITEAVFSDGKEQYRLQFEDKAAYKTGPANRGTEFRFDWDEVSNRDKTAGYARQIDNMTVAGKDCEAFEVSKKNKVTRFAGWNHILLYMELTTKSMNSVHKAVKVEENAAVPSEKFRIPADFTLKEE